MSCGFVILFICFCYIHFFSVITSAFFDENLLESNYKTLNNDYEFKKQFVSKNLQTASNLNGFMPEILKKKSGKINKFKQPSEFNLELNEEKNYNFDSILSTLKNKIQFIHSKTVDVLKSSPCREVGDRNATLLRSIGKIAKTIVNLRPKSQFEISYCAGSKSIEMISDNFLVPELMKRVQSTSHITDSCAVNAQCLTIYRWKNAEVELKVANDNIHIHFSDKVLVPSGCTCVLNALQSGFSDLPIIIF